MVAGTIYPDHIVPIGAGAIAIQRRGEVFTAHFESKRLHVNWITRSCVWLPAPGEPDTWIPIPGNREAGAHG